eukprot:GHRR01025497.1.p1 GENE.GHRR01025497.1~~GHRR01025497.1.p1  ORF type:complete len:123 (+),score=11.96 GHRR01025497.1:647-1015(+)
MRCSARIHQALNSNTTMLALPQPFPNYQLSSEAMTSRLLCYCSHTCCTSLYTDKHSGLVPPLLDLHTVRSGNNAHIHHVEEQAVINHTLQGEDGLAGCVSILDRGLQGSSNAEGIDQIKCAM